MPFLEALGLRALGLGAGHRVLLVDPHDEGARVAELIRASTPGVEVCHVAGLDGARGFVSDRSVRVVVADVHLVEVDGVEVVTRLRATFPDQPIVVLTQADEEALGLEVMRAGAQDFVSKGAVDAAVLRRALRYAVERKHREDLLESMATLDPLTRIGNRYAFERALAGLVAADLPFGVAFVDVDRFKRINDAHGHAVGDQVLTEVARRIVSVTRREDAVARIGGDEFVVLVPGLPGSDVAALGVRIQDAVAAPMLVRGQWIRATVSVGVAARTSAPAGVEDVVLAADAAMFEAKRTGGARVRVGGGAERTRAARRLELESELQAALDRDEFTAAFQPIVGLSGDHPPAFEALLRWRHPTRGLVAAGEFVGVLEEVGEIGRVGRRVIDVSLSWLARYRTLVHPGARVAVNLSSRELHEGAVVDGLLDALDAHGLPPDALDVEVTETATLDAPHEARAALRDLRDVGVGVLLDDFGTGYSSLSHLYQLPATGVKVDRLFVQDEQSRILDGVVALAATLGLRVIAEGVETDAQLERVRRVGCDQAQGFRLGRPALGEHWLAADVRALPRNE
jgi:diguanylate cyclase (GGDEF)-like protein